MEENNELSLDCISIGLIGLGYVGLPLATEFGKKYPTVGFDININRIDELKLGIDNTNEVEEGNILQSQLTFSSSTSDLINCNVYIVTVPTPVDRNNEPDFTSLIKASELVGGVLQKGNLVIYESTVFPGATEEICVPVLEEFSGLTFNKEFFCGYSPERINPGDKNHRLVDIIKVTSGSTPVIADFVDNLYGSIIRAGTFKAKSIKIAEAAKVIENTQRDVNIGLINELSIIFKTLGLDTKDVLEAAQTKWNFLPFKPGLVGGHCIGVDPYYLTYKSLQEGYRPEMILSGRRLNDSMADHIGDTVTELMIEQGIEVQTSSILILGFTFKENCPDYRNTKIVDLYLNLQKKVYKIDIFDPWVDSVQVKKDHDIDMIGDLITDSYDAIILAVSHDIFLEYSSTGFKEFAKRNAVIYDIKHFLPASVITARL